MKVDLSVYAKYPSSFSSTSEGSSTNLGLALASLFGATGTGATVYEQGTYNNLNNNTGSFLASALSPGSSTVPKAYLNYVFFDQDFNLVTAKSGYQQVTASSSGAFAKIEANNLTMDESGYLYVYLSNEGRTSDGGNVYFDALRIEHTKGAILQEDHYYPFGFSYYYYKNYYVFMHGRISCLNQCMYFRLCLISFTALWVPILMEST